MDPVPISRAPKPLIIHHSPIRVHPPPLWSRTFPMAPEAQRTFASERVILARRENRGITLVEDWVITQVRRLLNDQDGDTELLIRDGAVFRIELEGAEKPVYATSISVRMSAGKVMMTGCRKIELPKIQKGWGGETLAELKPEDTAPDKKMVPGDDPAERERRRMAVEMRLRAFIAVEATQSPTGMRLAKMVITRLGVWNTQKGDNEQLSSLNHDPRNCVASEIIVRMLFEKAKNPQEQLRKQQFVVLCEKIASGDGAAAEWAATLLKNVNIADKEAEAAPKNDHIAVVSGGRQITILDVRKMLLEGTQAQRDSALRLVGSMCNPKHIKIMANQGKMRQAFEDVADILDLTQRPKAAKGHVKFDHSAVGKIASAMGDVIGDGADRGSFVDGVLKARDKLRQQPPPQDEKSAGQ